MNSLGQKLSSTIYVCFKIYELYTCASVLIFYAKIIRPISTRKFGGRGTYRVACGTDQGLNPGES